MSGFAHEASLSLTVSWSLFKFMSIESVMLSNYLILCCPQSFPASGSFPVSWLFTSCDQSFRVSVMVLPMNIHGWSLGGLTDLISLQSQHSQQSSPPPQFKSINSSTLNLLYCPQLIRTSIFSLNSSCEFPLCQSQAWQKTCEKSQ